jgi:hypothetical protein
MHCLCFSSHATSEKQSLHEAKLAILSCRSSVLYASAPLYCSTCRSTLSYRLLVPHPANVCSTGNLRSKNYSNLCSKLGLNLCSTVCSTLGSDLRYTSMDTGRLGVPLRKVNFTTSWPSIDSTFSYVHQIRTKGGDTPLSSWKGYIWYICIYVLQSALLPSSHILPPGSNSLYHIQACLPYICT